jgi:hypothetical protein
MSRKPRGEHLKTNKGYDVPYFREAVKDLGIERRVANRWQAESRVPEKEIEKYAAEATSGGKEVTCGKLR